MFAHFLMIRFKFILDTFINTKTNPQNKKRITHIHIYINNIFGIKSNYFKATTKRKIIIKTQLFQQ